MMDSRIVTAWKELNREQVQINAHFCDTYGGPDVERSVAPALFDRRQALGIAKQALERQMTSEEIDSLP